MAFYNTQSEEPKVGPNGVNVAPASKDALLRCFNYWLCSWEVWPDWTAGVNVDMRFLEILQVVQKFKWIYHTHSLSLYLYLMRARATW